MSALPPVPRTFPVLRMTEAAAAADAMVLALLGSEWKVSIVAEHDSGDPRLTMRCPAPARGRPAVVAERGEGPAGLDGLVECVRRHTREVYADADLVLLQVSRPGLEPTQVSIRL